MVLGGSADAPHHPRAALIDAYGEGGFRFGGMSHRGSLLWFSDGIWAWAGTDVAELAAESLFAAFNRAANLGFFLIRSGRDPLPLPDHPRARFCEFDPR